MFPSKHLWPLNMGPFYLHWWPFENYTPICLNFSRWWCFFNFHPYLEKWSNLTNIFKWVETTNQFSMGVQFWYNKMMNMLRYPFGREINWCDKKASRQPHGAALAVRESERTELWIFLFMLCDGAWAGDFVVHSGRLGWFGICQGHERGLPDVNSPGLTATHQSVVPNTFKTLDQCGAGLSTTWIYFNDVFIPGHPKKPQRNLDATFFESIVWDRCIMFG